MPYNIRMVNFDEHRIELTSYNVLLKGMGRDALSAQIYLCLHLICGKKWLSFRDLTGVMLVI